MPSAIITADWSPVLELLGRLVLSPSLREERGREERGREERGGEERGERERGRVGERR
jgi:hypothetical protein